MMAQPFFGKGLDKLVLSGSGKHDAENTQEFVLVRGHILDRHHWKLYGPYPAHLGHPVIGFFQGGLLAESLRILAVAKALSLFHHTASRRVVNGIDRLLHVVQPALLRKTVLISPLGYHTAVLVSAATGLAHVERHFVLGAVGRGEIEVCGEHAGGHVAELAAYDVPGAGVQFFLHTISRKLDDTSGHVLPFVPGVTGDAAQPAGLLTQLRDVEGFIQRHVHIRLLFLRRTTAMFIMFAISQIASVRFSQLGSKIRIT